MRIHTNRLTVTAHETGDRRRPVALWVGGLLVQMNLAEARCLADQIHDVAEGTS